MNKLAVGIATMKGRELSLKDTISSLINQVDLIYIYINNYRRIPKFLKDPKIIISLAESGDIGDVGKFYGLKHHKGYYFTCDDDIIYPNDYIAKLKKGIDKYKKKSIITVHGRIFNDLPVFSYYKSHSSYFHFKHYQNKDSYVHAPGTGVMGFHTNTFCPDIEEFKISNMADVWVSFLAHNKYNINIISIAHKANWLRDSPNYSTSFSIYKACHNDDITQTNIINKTNLKPIKNFLYDKKMASKS